MARYISDQNKVVLIQESGTYGSTSGVGVWAGLVQSNEVDENENLIETRYLGNQSRNFALMAPGPRDRTGTLTNQPQNSRFLGFALGSIVDTSGTNATHIFSEINTDVRQSVYTSGVLNPIASFTLEDSKQAPGTGRNFIRTLNGCVIDTYSITATQGEPVVETVGYIAQTLNYSSGATTSVTADTNRQFLWSDVSVTLGGSVIQTLKEATYELNNNTEAPHYLNGSRDISVPFRQNRTHTFTVVTDLDTEEAKGYYDRYYLGGSTFNAVFDLNADGKAGITGSLHTILTFSGCRIADMENPSALEGSNENSMTIRPQSVTATSYDRILTLGAF